MEATANQDLSPEHVRHQPLSGIEPIGFNSSRLKLRLVERLASAQILAAQAEHELFQSGQFTAKGSRRAGAERYERLTQLQLALSKVVGLAS